MFTRPGYALFADLLTGWALCPGRRTLTRVLAAGDLAGRRAHDAYHRFVRCAAWSPAALWQALAVHAIEMAYPGG